MLFDEANEVFEIFKGSLPFYVILFLPILIIVSPLNPVDGAHEFTVYRMQQYDLQGNNRGCRSSVVNVEARTVNGGVLARRCVIARLLDLNPFKYKDVINQGAGAILILVPDNLTSLSMENRQHVAELENAMLTEETQIPVYFVTETKDLLNIYQSIHVASIEDQTISASQAIMSAVMSTGFQMVTSGAQSKPISNCNVASIQGKLSGFGVEDQLPTIALVAHYDSFGVAPGLSVGADSNGSGVAALLELARLFSRLYANPKTQPKFNILFLLSGGGKFEGGLLQDSVYTLCLDTVGSGDNLYLHVSKPPKEGSAGAIVLRELKMVTNRFYPDAKFDMVHKKINLAEDTLAWEHERFSIRRLPAFTVSGLSSPREQQRNSILDTRDQVDVDVLYRNVKLIAEALARCIYNITQPEIEVFTESLAVQKDRLAAWMDYLTATPRAAQMLVEPSKSQLILDLQHELSRFISDVRLSVAKPEKRDPEFTFYDAISTTMTAYSVKPAVFDLVLMIAVAVYLCALYFIIQAFPKFYWMVAQMGVKMKQT
uniref:BOS complex subunit NCLN n=1 Tax=Strigamia maritima TaxID=126957 RepID=T1JL86_STRMM